MLTPKQIKKMRADLNMTQEELAHALDYKLRTVKYAECNKQKMSVRYEKILRNYYHRNFIPAE